MAHSSQASSMTITWCTSSYCKDIVCAIAFAEMAFDMHVANSLH